MLRRLTALTLAAKACVAGGSCFRSEPFGKAMSPDLAARLARPVAAFHARHPPRTWSLIVSLLGDAVLPRGGVIQAGVISEFCGLVGIDAGSVRTALSRLVARRIVARERDGRKSFYRLTAAERADFTRAADLIYGRRIIRPTGDWDLATLDSAESRGTLRTALSAQRFVPLGPMTMIRPAHADDAAQHMAGLRLFRAQSADNPDDLARTLWPLAELGAAYRAFIAHFAGFDAGPEPAPDVAIVARVLLVHEFRRALLKDPVLPASALPVDWPAQDARILFARAYKALTPAAEAWITARIDAG